MRTNVSNIFAIGDITGKVQLAHVASAQGIVAAHCISGENKKINYNMIPGCVYTNPEIASVGLTQAQAVSMGKKITVGTYNISGNGKSMIMGNDVGQVKIVADHATGEILGAHIMAPRATDMIAEIVAVMECEGTIDELSSAIHPHPTVSEIIMEAAHDAEGLCCHKI